MSVLRKVLISLWMELRILKSRMAKDPKGKSTGKGGENNVDVRSLMTSHKHGVTVMLMMIAQMSMKRHYQEPVLVVLCALALCQVCWFGPRDLVAFPTATIKTTTPHQK